MELKEVTNEEKKFNSDPDNIRDLKNIKEKTSKKKPTSSKPEKTSLCRACAYFIIYSFLGFIIETLFALINYGVLESRQGFLYGPFCCIYGLRSSSNNCNFKS